ncbi:MAG: CoA pyrophosphatase [Thaumarchaeota archaeon]|nr:CoA pyrophosphatase [Nitrososphaerota archaeon]
MESLQLLEVLKSHLIKEEKIDEGILAAVIVIIYFPSGNPHILLTRRSDKLKKHAGEISCPGGTYLDSDKDLLHTAIRETHEEIGISIDKNNIIGCLRGVHTLTSNFTIVPYIAIIDEIENPKPSINEIKEIIDVPLIDLLKTVESDLNHMSFGNIYKFVYNDNVIWGATAKILKQIYDILHKSGMI